jgi:hypothetical protein
MSAQAEEVVASAASLSGMATNLEALVARFKLEAGDNDLGAKLAIFRKAHLGWIGRLESMAAGGETIAESQAAAFRDCGLGKWYYGQGQAEFGQSPAFQAIEPLHTRFHGACKRAVEAHSRRDSAATTQAIAEARRGSTEVVSAIDALEAAQRGSTRISEVSVSTPRDLSASQRRAA